MSTKAVVAHWNETISLPELLLSLGEDLSREGLEDTPERVRKAWEEMLEGYTINPDELLERTFEVETLHEDHTDEDDDNSYEEGLGTFPDVGIQVCRDISFVSFCEHHLLPFYGTITIGYQARERVVGLSKLARLADAFSKRLQIQERLTNQIAETLFRNLRPIGVVVNCDATHFCCKGRGVRRTSMHFGTIAQRGNVSEMLLQQTLRV